MEGRHSVNFPVTYAVASATLELILFIAQIQCTNTHTHIHAYTHLWWDLCRRHVSIHRPYTPSASINRPCLEICDVSRIRTLAESAKTCARAKNKDIHVTKFSWYGNLASQLSCACLNRRHRKSCPSIFLCVCTSVCTSVPYELLTWKQKSGINIYQQLVQRALHQP